VVPSEISGFAFHTAFFMAFTRCAKLGLKFTVRPKRNEPRGFFSAISTQDLLDRTCQVVVPQHTQFLACVASVSKRMRELGIRMALGAQRRQVLRAALGRAVQLLAFGSAAGLLLGIFASRVLAAIVYQATPRDPFVLTGVVLAMALLGLLATWIPAQRALSIEPLKLLREENALLTMNDSSPSVVSPAKNDLDHHPKRHRGGRLRQRIFDRCSLFAG
jgi:FtsX-like permease family